MNGIKEDQIVYEEREQKNWYKDPIEEKYHKLDVSMYKMENLYCL